MAEASGVTEKMLKRLHDCFQPSIVPEELPCRNDDVRQIRSFVEGNLKADGGGCMYISGVPGTGKTASVRLVFKRLLIEKKKGNLPDFAPIELNAMFLSDPKRIFVEFYKQLLLQNGKEKFFSGIKRRSNVQVSPAFAMKQLDRLFDLEDSERPAVVLLLDELDALVTKRQEHLYRIFNYSTQPGAKLTVIAIANTLDLPERMLVSRNSSRLGLRRLIFQPYNHKQIEEILISRFCDEPEAVERDGIEFISRKIAAVSGDIRRAFEICRMAVEIALSKLRAVKASTPASSAKRRKSERIQETNACVGRVTRDCALQAVKQLATNVKVQAVKFASLHEKLLLEAVVNEHSRLGSDGIPFENIWVKYGTLCSERDVEKLYVGGLLDIANRLVDCRLLARVASSNYGLEDFTSCYRLNVDPGDVKMALEQ